MNKETKRPVENADIDFIIDLVETGGINYSFTDHSEGTHVDFKYFKTRFDDDTLIEITDKIKDAVINILIEVKEREEEEQEDEEDEE